MSWLSGFGDLIQAAAPHYGPLALILSRLLPITFLCPLFGGMSIPSTVRFALSLALALGIHIEGGVGVIAPTQSLLAAGLRELCLGTAIGLIASLPFDAARIGGRFVDLFRGSTAEAALPGAGTKESALSEGLHQWMVSLVAASALYSLILGSVVRSFGWLPLGRWEVTQNVAIEVARLVGVAVGTGLAIGAPVAALSLFMDLLMGILSRAVPQLHFSEMSGPVKILGGAAVVWLSLGIVAERLLRNLGAQAEILHSVVIGP